MKTVNENANVKNNNELNFVKFAVNVPATKFEKLVGTDEECSIATEDIVVPACYVCDCCGAKYEVAKTNIDVTIDKKVLSEADPVIDNDTLLSAITMKCECCGTAKFVAHDVVNITSNLIKKGYTDVKSHRYGVRSTYGGKDLDQDRTVEYRDASLNVSFSMPVDELLDMDMEEFDTFRVMVAKAISQLLRAYKTYDVDTKCVYKQPFVRYYVTPSVLDPEFVMAKTIGDDNLELDVTSEDILDYLKTLQKKFEELSMESITSRALDSMPVIRFDVDMNTTLVGSYLDDIIDGKENNELYVKTIETQKELLNTFVAVLPHLK